METNNEEKKQDNLVKDVDTKNNTETLGEEKKVNLEPVVPVAPKIENSNLQAPNELQNELQQQQLKEQQNFRNQQAELQKKREQEAAIKAKAEQEELEKLNTTEKGGPSGVKTFFGFVFIGLLIAFVIFMPQITDFIAFKKAEKASEALNTGTLVCTMSKVTSNLNESYNAAFSFNNRKITKLIFTTTITGDKNKDKKELNNLFDECENIQTVASNLKGVSVGCKLDGGILKNIQTFDYENITDNDSVSTAFIEAGGIYSDYKKGDDITSVETRMTSSGYNCTKETYVQ